MLAEIGPERRWVPFAGRGHPGRRGGARRGDVPDRLSRLFPQPAGRRGPGLAGEIRRRQPEHRRGTRDLGLVEQHDRGAATFYTPTPRLLGESEEEPDKGAAKGSKAAEKPSKDSEKPSKEPGEQSIKHPPKPHKPPEKPHKAEGEPSRTWEESVRSALPPDLAESIDELNRWTPQVELRRLIVRLCAWQPMTAAELTQLLGRSRTYLRNAYIGPMIKNGDLEYTNPENPRDPEQRYQARGE